MKKIFWKIIGIVFCIAIVIMGALMIYREILDYEYYNNEEDRMRISCKSDSEISNVTIGSHYDYINNYDKVPIYYTNENDEMSVGPVYIHVKNKEPVIEDNFSIQWNDEVVTIGISSDKQQDIILELSTNDSWEMAKSFQEIEEQDKVRYKKLKRIINQSSSEDGLKRVYVCSNNWTGLTGEIKVIYEDKELKEKAVFETSIANDRAKLHASHCQIQWEEDAAVLILNGQEQAEYVWKISFGE